MKVRIKTIESMKNCPNIKVIDESDYVKTIVSKENNFDYWESPYCNFSKEIEDGVLKDGMIYTVDYTTYEFNRYKYEEPNTNWCLCEDHVEEELR